MVLFFFFVGRVGLSGGLSIFWNNEATISLLGYSVGQFDVLISVHNAPTFRFIGFYGNPISELTRFSWDLIRRLHSLSNFPWLVTGDFNEILLLDEKIGEERITG